MLRFPALFWGHLHSRKTAYDQGKDQGHDEISDSYDEGKQEKASTTCHSHPSHKPDSGCSCKPPDRITSNEYKSRANEAYSGYDLGGDSRRIKDHATG